MTWSIGKHSLLCLVMDIALLATTLCTVLLMEDIEILLVRSYGVGQRSSPVLHSYLFVL